MARRAAIPQQRIRLVKDEEGAKIGGLLEGGGKGCIAGPKGLGPNPRRRRAPSPFLAYKISSPETGS